MSAHYAYSLDRFPVTKPGWKSMNKACTWTYRTMQRFCIATYVLLTERVFRFKPHSSQTQQTLNQPSRATTWMVSSDMFIWQLALHLVHLQIFTLSSIQQSRRATCKNRMKETYRNGHPCSARLRLHTVRPPSYLPCLQVRFKQKHWCALYRVYVAARILNLGLSEPQFCLTLLTSSVDTVRC